MNNQLGTGKKKPAPVYYALAVIFLIAWLAQGIFLLSVPDQSIRQLSRIFQEMADKYEPVLNELKRDERVDLDIKNVESNSYRDVRLQLKIQTMLVVFGVVTSFLVLISQKLWLFCAMAVSLSYLLFWFNFGVTSHVNLWLAYRAKWMLVEATGRAELFFLQDIILPGLCVTIITVAIYRLLREDFFKKIWN